MATVQVRYIVDDVDAAIALYVQLLGFREVMHPALAFAMLARGDLRLVLSKPNPAAGGGQPMRMDDSSNPAAGTGSRSRWTIWRKWSRGFGSRVRASETRS